MSRPFNGNQAMLARDTFSHHVCGEWMSEASTLILRDQLVCFGFT